MKPILLCLTILLIFNISYADRLKGYTSGSAICDEVTSIYDGDTFRCNIKDYPPLIGYHIPVRIYGIDTPELKDKRPKIKELARQAKQFTAQQLRGAKVVELRNMRRGKYFRILADVYVDGKNLGGLLIRKGLARPYFGGKRAW